MDERITSLGSSTQLDFIQYVYSHKYGHNHEISDDIKTQNVSNKNGFSLNYKFSIYVVVNSPYPRHSLVRWAYIISFGKQFRDNNKHLLRIPSMTT